MAPSAMAYASAGWCNVTCTTALYTGLSHSALPMLKVEPTPALEGRLWVEVAIERLSLQLMQPRRCWTLQERGSPRRCPRSIQVRFTSSTARG